MLLTGVISSGNTSLYNITLSFLQFVRSSAEKCLQCASKPIENEALFRNINNLRYADDTTLMAESEEELKSLLMKVKGESEKSWLKAQHSENEDHGI